MIRLNNESIIRKFTSSVFSHPTQTGTNYVPYILNHNEGSPQNLSTLHMQNGTTSWLEVPDMYQDSANAYRNWQPSLNAAVSNDNATEVRVYRISSVTRNIRIELYWL